MARIESDRQRDLLKARYDQVQGAIALHQAVGQHLNEMVKGYLEQLAVVAGIELGEGDKVTVDWGTGEVTVEPARAELLGVQEMPVMNGVPHE